MTKHTPIPRSTNPHLIKPTRHMTQILALALPRRILFIRLSLSLSLGLNLSLSVSGSTPNRQIPKFTGLGRVILLRLFEGR